MACLHRDTDKGCPHCLMPLIEVAGTGLLFCSNHSVYCDYEWRKNQRSDKANGILLPLNKKQYIQAKYSRDTENFQTVVKREFKKLETNQGLEVALEQLQIALKKL